MKKSPKLWNSLPEKNNSKEFYKKTQASLAAILTTISLAQQPANANNNKLVNSLENNSSKVFKSDLKNASSDTYPAFLNIYWVWQKVWWNSFNWVWIKVHNKHFEWVAEKWPDYTKVWAIGKINFWDTWAYTKIWASYLKFDNYKVGQYSINPKQKTFGWALWYGNNHFNVEWGYIAHELTWAKLANTTAYTKYLELVGRAQSKIWQFDLTWTIKNQNAYDKSRTYFNTSWAYYPTKDIQLETTYDNSNPYIKNDYEVKAWIKYTFGWNKKWKFSPYLSTEYSVADNVKVEATYANSIANRPLSWKDEFENNINTNQIVAQKVAPKEFEKKVKESLNKPPKISILASATSITEWESVTLTANASDPDGTVKEIDWYDKNGNKIGSGKSITITPSSTGTFTYYAKAIDNNWAVSKSKSISINVEAVPNQPPKISILASATSITEWEAVTLNANASDPDGTVKEIDWYDQNGNKIGSGKSITITPSSTGTFTYYAEAIDNKGAVSKSKPISINVEAVPTPTLSLEIWDWDWDWYKDANSVTINNDKIIFTYTSAWGNGDWGTTEFGVKLTIWNGWYIKTDWNTYHNWDNAVMVVWKNVEFYKSDWTLYKTYTVGAAW